MLKKKTLLFIYCLLLSHSTLWDLALGADTSPKMRTPDANRGECDHQAQVLRAGRAAERPSALQR